MTSDKLKKRAGTITAWIIILLILCQFVPLNRIGQPAGTPAGITAVVRKALESHCLNCHSGQTRWPRTAYIAPLSWYVTGKVHAARKALNFSDYDSLPETARVRLEKSVSNLAGTARLSAHGSIPGFPTIRMAEKERLTLARWSEITIVNKQIQ
jgi:hypothetical protein